MQSFIAGATDYSTQTLKNILDDVRRWVAYCNKIIKLSNSVSQIDKPYIDKIPFDFRCVLLNFTNEAQSLKSDLRLIAKDLKKKRVLDSTYKLLSRIGVNSLTLFRDLKKTYKADSYWKDYDDENFKKVENLYCENGDFYATLFDASNAAERLKDYMNDEKKSKVKIVAKNSIVGDNNNVKINSENEETDENKEKHKFYGFSLFRSLLPY